MIVMLRGKVLRGLRGLHFGHRSRPGDELLANHVLGQLLRRAAVRRDDPAALLSPRLLPPSHHSLQSSSPYAPRAIAAGERVCPPFLRPMGCENGAGPGGSATPGSSTGGSAAGPGTSAA